MNPSHKKPQEEGSEGVGFALTGGDIEIFRLLYEYRLLRTEHVSALTLRSPKKIHGRLIKLVRKHYIIVIRLPQQKHIYSLGREALPVLVEQGIASPELLDERLRVRELKDLFLKHEMMIVDLHVVMAMASRERLTRF